MISNQSTPDILKTLDEAPLNRHHLKMLLLAVGGTFLDGFDISIMSFAILLIIPVFHPNAFEIGWIGAAVVVGSGVGSILAGYLSDKVGRRLLFILDFVLFIVFAGLSALAQNIPELIILRFLVGVGIGIDYPVSTALLSEASPKKHRGKLLALWINGFNVGAMCSLAVGALLFHVGPNAWRWMLAAEIIPAGLVLVGRRGVPESTRWLLSRGRNAEAKAELSQLGLRDSSPSGTGETAPVSGTSASPSYVALVRGKYRRPAIFIALYFFFFQFAFFGFNVFGPYMLKGLHLRGVGATAIALIIFWIIYIIGNALFVWKGDTIGRRRFSLWGWAGMAVAMIAIYALFPLPIDIFLLFFALYFFTAGMGPGTIHEVYSPELFPTFIRSTGEGWKQGWGKVGAVIGLLFIPLLLGINPKDPILMGAVACVVGLGVTWFLAPETAQRSLEDLTESDPIAD